MYDLVISIYAGLVRLARYFNPKAKLMIDGHRQVFDVLEREMDVTKKYIWFHAASLGEFEQGRPIIEKLKSNHPDYKVLLTFFSPSGYEVRKDYPLADIVCYLPFDKRRNVLKFLKLANPKMAVFIKYEFWYNYLTELHEQKIPTFIVSAVFRPTQMFFKWYGVKARKILTYYRTICVQDEKSKDILSTIGIDNVKICGDTRFDRVVDICQQAKQLPLIEQFIQSGANARIFTAGSSWPKDEELILPFINANPEWKLIIAPHEIHESHLLSIEKSLKRKFIRYSQLDKKNPADFDCIILDCFGLLSSVYRYADVAYVGGGFGVGIHNVLEAAVYGIPVLFGSNYHKFREAVGLIESGGGFSVNGKAEFLQQMDSFQMDEHRLKRAGKCSADYVLQNTKAVEKALIELEKYL